MQRVVGLVACGAEGVGGQEAGGSRAVAAGGLLVWWGEEGERGLGLYFKATAMQGLPSCSLRRTKRAMSCCGYIAEPTLKPPPWMKAKTGRLLSGVVEAGTVILRHRPSVSDIVKALRSYSRVCWRRPNSGSGPGAMDRTCGLWFC